MAIFHILRPLIFQLLKPLLLHIELFPFLPEDLLADLGMLGNYLPPELPPALHALHQVCELRVLGLQLDFHVFLVVFPPDDLGVGLFENEFIAVWVPDGLGGLQTSFFSNSFYFPVIFQLLLSGFGPSTTHLAFFMGHGDFPGVCSST